MSVRLRCGWLLGFLLATTAWPADGPPPLRRVDVPADRPDLWPPQARSMVAVPRDEFERLWAAAQPRESVPPQATLEAAHYEGTIDGATLGPGRCTWRVRRFASRPVWLSLGHSNLALEGLTWSDRPAIWGADAAGTLWLWVDAPTGELSGRWAVTGQIVADETRFGLELPAAQTSRLTVTTPARRALVCEDAPLQARGSAEAPRTWEVALGSRTECRLRMAGIVDEQPPKLLTYRRQQFAMIREDHLRFQTAITPEVLDGEVRELTISVPAAVEILSISWGADVPLSWTRATENNARSLVTVTLPDLVGGALRPIQIEGLLPRRASNPTSVPDVELKDGVFVSGDVHVTVARPLEVVSVRATGCRQQAPVSTNSEGEVYSFRQLRPESLLTFEVRTPRSSLAAHVLSVVTMTDDIWTQQTDVAWRSISGTAFQLAMRLPAGWEVIDIDAYTESGVQERINWERLPDTDGATKLAVELLEALRPETPRRLSIWSRRRPLEEGNPFPNPAVRPLDCQSVETVLAFRSGAKFWLTTDETGPLTSIDPAQLAAPWTSLPLRSLLHAERNEIDACFHSVRSNDPAFLQLERRPLPVAAEVAVRTTFDQGVLTEECRIHATAAERGATERLLVFVTQPGGEIAWRVEQPPGIELLSRRLPDERHFASSLPSGGEWWELRLPPLATQDVVVAGTRAQPLTLPAHIGLVAIPQAEAFTAKVDVAAADSLGLQPSATRLESLPAESRLVTEPTKSPVRHWAWRYVDPHAVLTLVTRRHGLAETPCLTRLKLRSLIAANREAYDYHQAEVLVPPLDRPLHWQLPGDAELLTIALDGVREPPPSDSTITIPPTSGDRERRLQVLYRTAHRRGFLVDRSTIVVPTGDDLLWAGVRWEFFLPPGARLADEPLGVRLEQPLQQLNWWTRLFGPLGRTASQTLFLPWSLTSWRGLTTPASPPPAMISVTDSATLVPPSDWQGFVAYAPSTTDIRLVTWNAGRLRLLAWLGLLATFTLAAVLRMVGWGLRDRAAGLWLAVLGGCALTWEGPSSEIIGGVIAGTVVAILLPRRWLGWHWLPAPSPRPTGSTQSFQWPPGVMTTGTVLLLTMLIGWQSPVADEPAWQPETTVLVPVDADGKPSRSVPLVYLHPATLEQLRDAVVPVAASPSWLLQAADYEVTASPGQRWPVTATFEVLVCDPLPTVTIPLRLAGSSLAGAQACLVDGDSAAMTVDPQSGDLQVTIHRPEPAISAIGHDQPTRHTVVLRLQTPWKRSAHEVRLAAPLPTAPRSRWSLSGPLAPGTTPSGETGPKRSPLVQTFGPVPQAEVVWTDPTAPAVTTMRAEIEVTEVWDVTATLVEARTRSVLQPRTGPLQRLIVDLPPGSAISHVKIEPEARLQRLSSSATSRSAVIEFAEPLYESATIELDYVAPHASTDGEFFGRGLLFRAARTRAVLPQSRRWAIAAPADLRVEPQSLENSGLAPVSRASVQEALSGLVGERSPQAVYQVQGEAPIAFRWTPLASRRQLLLWQQTGTLERDRLKWELEGELEVSGAPVYSHVLSVDRRLRIESIVVRERGTDRLVRWSETRPQPNSSTNRVTLFLSDPCVDTQRITLTASATITPDAPLPLPNVRCEDAELRGGRLLFTAPRDTVVAWSSTRGLRSLNTNSAAGNEPASGQTWIYDQIEADWRATIRVHPAARSTDPWMLHVLQADGDEQVRLTTRCRFPGSGMRSPSEWLIPVPWSQAGQPTAERAAISIEQQPDGAWRVAALPDEGAAAAEVTWQFVAPRAAFHSGSLSLPRWLSDDGREASVWLAETTAPPVAPLLGDQPSETPPSEWAQRWLSDLSPMRSGQPRWRTLTIVDEALPLPVGEAAASAAIAWLEHVLWRMPDGSDVAVSLLRLSSPALVIAARFPSDCTYRAACADGRTALATLSDDVVRIAAAEGTAFSELRIYWTQRGEPTAAPLTPSSLDWPEFPGSSIAQQAVSVFPAAGEVLRPGGDWQAGDWVDRALLRLEVLSDQFASLPRPFLEREFLDGYTRLAETFGRQPAVLEAGGTQRAARWEAIVATTNKLDNRVVITGVDPPTETMAELLLDHPAARHGMVPATTTEDAMWRIDRTWARWLLRCLCVLALLPFLRLVVRRDWSEWLKARPQAATALLGVVWWLCLAPSIVGFALLVLAAVRALTPHRPVVEPEPVT